MNTYSFDYQSVCHCSKTAMIQQDKIEAFDYQSVCHCSKTKPSYTSPPHGLITSQFATAPKLRLLVFLLVVGLITSQFATAPKPDIKSAAFESSLITSQFATAPKRSPATMLPTSV